MSDGHAPAPPSGATGPRGPPDPAAMKARVMGHMNADHSLSLRLYLMRYCHVPMARTTTAKLLDMTNEHIIVESAYGRHVVPLEPPMKSLMEARDRLVAMHTDCLKELDLSDVVVDRYVPPDRAWQWIGSALCLLIFATFPFREQLKPESQSVIAQIWSLGGTCPPLANLCYTLQPYVLWFMIIVHSGEAAWFATTQLRRHWVELGSALWVCWVLDCAVEGVGCMSRFDRIFAQKDTTNKQH